MMLTPDDVVPMYAESTESLDATITASVDPTGTVPDFALLVDGTYPDVSTTWASGAWNGTWAAGTVLARTPLIGKLATTGFTLTAGSRYRVWVRFTAGGEHPVQPVGSIRVLGTPASVLPPLATVNDLETRLGSTIADPVRAAAVLADVSAVVRRESGQTITLVQSTERLIPNRDGYARLPQWPIVSIDSIVNDYNATFGPFSDKYGSVWSWLPVTVTYTHGYTVVPPVVVALVCQIAGRALATPASSAGVSSEQLGAYKYTIDAAAAAGPFGLLDSEMRVIKSLRRPAGATSMLPRPLGIPPQFGFDFGFPY